jgi:glycosyltransferase involved in cell wall biosynthesis
MRSKQPIRVLYSFPHKIGAGRICYTAWEQVSGLASAGADVLVFPGAVARLLPPSVRVRPTLARGKVRIPYKLLGTMRALALHDYIVSRRMEKLEGKIDIVHTWPTAALQTLKVANRLGIVTVLERPNAHTRFAYETVQRESKRLGVTLPPNNEYAYKLDVLRKEEEEYRLTDYLLCASDFSIQSFLDQGVSREKILKHQYGFDEHLCYPDKERKVDPQRGLTMLFAGDAAVRKGVHFALEAWLKSPAHQNGTFLIAGGILPAYAEKISSMLSHPSIRVLGHRRDVPELMRNSDILVLPSIEEGFGLVCVEAIGSGCVPLVSTACTDICKHMENALVHEAGDVLALTRHITQLHQDRGLLARLRSECLKLAPKVTWAAAGVRLHEVYREALNRREKENATYVASSSITEAGQLTIKATDVM